MHIGKLSAIVAQVSLTSASVLAGEEMGKRQTWQDVKAAGLQKAGEAEARGSQISGQFQQAAHAAEAEAKEISSENQKRDNWQDAKASALAKAAEWEAQASKISAENQQRDVAADASEPVITPAPVLNSRQFPWGNRNGGGFGGNNNNNNNNNNRGGFGGNGGFERGRQQGIAAAERAKAQWANRFGGNNNRGGFGRSGGNNNNRGGFGGFGRGGSAEKRDVDEEDQVEARDNSYPTAPYNSDGWYPDSGGNANNYGNPYPGNGQPAPVPAPAPGPYGGGAAAAADNWQGDVASANSVAGAWQDYGSSLGQSYAAYGSSVAASYQSEYAPQPTYANDGWQGDVASAQSLASSYRSEYGAAPAPTTTWGEQYTPAPTGHLPAPKGTSMVQVNGGVTDRTQSFTIAAAMGAAFAAAAIGFGRL